MKNQQVVTSSIYTEATKTNQTSTGENNMNTKTELTATEARIGMVLNDIRDIARPVNPKIMFDDGGLLTRNAKLVSSFAEQINEIRTTEQLVDFISTLKLRPRATSELMQASRELAQHAVRMQAAATALLNMVEILNDSTDPLQ